MNFQLMNEIATNVCMALQPYKNYLEPYKLKNIKLYPIIIEGLDCIGKETLTKRIRTELGMKGFIVQTLSFPNYESDSGKEISAILHGEDIKKNPPMLIQKLTTLMVRNRMETLVEFANKNDDDDSKGYTVVLILDRFFLSNLAYSSTHYETQDDLLELVQGSGLYNLAKFESDMYFDFFNNNNRGISIICSYNENDDDKFYDKNVVEAIEDSHRIHKEFLDKKENKDSYETIEKQKKVSTVYDIVGIDKAFHKVEHYLRFRPIDTLAKDTTKIIKAVADLVVYDVASSNK